MEQEGGRSAGWRIAAAAGLLAGSAILSRILGFVREVVLAYAVGAGAGMDAYRAAFQLPDYLNYLLAGGGLSIAFIPLYTYLRENRGPEVAERLMATVLGTAGLAVALGTAALWWWAEPLIALQFGGPNGFAPETQELTVRLTRIVLPAQIFFVVGGVLRGVSMAHGRFLPQALAPVVYNLCIIAGGLLLGGGPEGFAWGVLGGAILGNFGIALLDARHVVRLRARVSFVDRDLGRYLLVAAPLMLGLSLLTVDEWYERLFGSRLGEGVVARLGYARLLMLAPVSVVGQAVATAALPTFSRLYAEERLEELGRTLLRALQASLGIGILSAAAVGLLAFPLTRVLFERGAFTAEDTVAVARLLRVLCLAVPAWVVQQIAVRAFFARGDTWRPMLLSTAVALLAIPLYLALGERYGAAGLAAAGVIAISANALATLVLARWVHGAPALTPLLVGLGRALVVVVPSAGVAWALLPGRSGSVGALLDLAVGGGVYALGVVAGIAIVGDEPTRAAGRRLARSVLRRVRGA